MILAWLGLTLALADPGLQAYDAGDLEAARAAWEDAERPPRAEAAYNLGNVWFRLEDPARAVGWYRRALSRLPRQGDVMHNLAVARAALPGSVPPPVNSRAVWLDLLTVGEWATLAALGGALGSLGLLLGVWRRAALRAAALVWTGAALAGGLAAIGAWEEHQHPVVVALDPTLLSRDLPDPQAAPSGEWSGGTELWVVHRGEGFWLVEDSRGRRGWVRAAAVLPATP